MAKIHRIEMYIIDYNDQCESEKELEGDIIDIFDHCDLNVIQIESKSSEYDWNDENEDYEGYFN